MRWVSTRVLPEPAPARMSSGPSVAVTARACSGLRRLTMRSASASGPERVCGGHGRSCRPLPSDARDGREPGCLFRFHLGGVGNDRSGGALP